MLKHTTFHKSFRLNNNSFDAINDLLAYALHFSPEIHYFLEDWFSEKEVVVVKTSGSTGAPKLIQLQKKQMHYSALATGDFFQLKEKKTALLCLPITYIAGKMMLVRALTLGWHLDVVNASSNPLSTLSRKYDFTAMVPLQLENSIDKLDLIKKLIVGGGFVSNRLQEKLQLLATEVFGTYGMTETITHIAVKKLNRFSLLRTSGKKSIFRKEVISSTNAGNNGFYEILPNTTIYKDERNCLVIENSKVSNEVVFTNDVVALVSDTQFQWLGRLDNVINSGGIKLHPERIEDKLSKIIVQRFFVAGIPDEKLGEKLILIIEGANNTIDIQKANLSRFEIPKEIYFVANFIETATKKIQRKKTLDLIFI
ncbi:AMP-binding protein [Polaribacter sp.]|nr:AMP-binding protein [Polaribacter sp.]MDB4205538.1 AMP-binding protein [Polaribacter sp.]MDC1237327.1 AMP-binding protein [Polaribacter sp.]